MDASLLLTLNMLSLPFPHLGIGFGKFFLVSFLQLHTTKVEQRNLQKLVFSSSFRYCGYLIVIFLHNSSPFFLHDFISLENPNIVIGVSQKI